MVRFKSRYIVFQIFQENQLISGLFNTNTTFQRSSFPIKLTDELTTLTSHALLNLIKEHVYFNFGDWGQGLIAASLNSKARYNIYIYIDIFFLVKYYSPATHTGIIRVSRQHYRLVWAVLTFIKTIQDQPVLIRVLRINGTIKKAEMFLIQRNKDLLIKEKLGKNI